MRCSCFNLACLTVCLLVCAMLLKKMRLKPALERCWTDTVNKSSVICQLNCDKGYFSLPGMSSCHRWLQCGDMNHVEIGKEIGQGAVKQVYLGKWGSKPVVVSKLRTLSFYEDFIHGLEMLMSYQPHPLFAQLVGFCLDQDKSIILTQYYPLGSASNLHMILSSTEYLSHNTLRTRFQLCIDYAAILSRLHNNDTGAARIMCDSSSLDKTLQQYLITSDMHLIVNDLDALPLVDSEHNVTAVCGHRELVGDFVAPEQLWPYEDEDYTDELMPGYTEKTDIWKVPDVCEFFLGEYPQSQVVKFHLFKIHRQCKDMDANRRPTASDVLEEYRNTWEELKMTSNAKEDL